MFNAKFFGGLFLLVLIVLGTLFCLNRMKSESEAYDFLPELKKSNLNDVKFKKIFADPSYLVPYNVLISFKTDKKNILESLGLKKINDVDTNVLRTDTWIEEYRLYFTMQSVNGGRYKSMENEAKEIRWWNLIDSAKVFAAPYIDKSNVKRIVKFGEKNNGRIGCCKIGDTYFVLIECWG